MKGRDEREEEGGRGRKREEEGGNVDGVKKRRRGAGPKQGIEKTQQSESEEEKVQVEIQSEGQRWKERKRGGGREVKKALESDGLFDELVWSESGELERELLSSRPSAPVLLSSLSSCPPLVPAARPWQRLSKQNNLESFKRPAPGMLTGRVVVTLHLQEECVGVCKWEREGMSEGGERREERQRLECECSTSENRETPSALMF
ncbi:unnamed protein product [Pleuronectes platessa]|uniref:Uncharacterized protein n=1 Tax=Pleuronectes platessa TaxID=8262 RepID=A0A9N7UTP4_PLEPL|nr:unnamed protein product [Pleuronectes platessa]